MAAAPVTGPVGALRRRLPALLPWSVLALALVGVAANLARVGRAQWFWGDEWEFIGNRGLVPGGRGLWEPHNEHWSTIPILVYQGLHALVGLRTYAPYLACVVLLHVAVSALAAAIARRTGAGPWPSAAVGIAVGCFGAGFENLLWAFQIGFIGSVALGLAHLLLVDHDGGWDRRDAAALALGLVALTFSGVTVTMVGVSAVAVLLRRGWRLAAATAAPLGLAYLAWFLVVGREGLVSGQRAAPGDIALFVGRGLRATTTGWIGSRDLGVAVLVALGAWAVARCLLPRPVLPGRTAPERAALAACTVGCVALFAVVGSGRTAGVPGSSRYLYLATALAAPLVARAVQDLLDLARVRHAALVALAAALVVAHPVVHGLGELQDRARDEAVREQRLRGLVLASADLAESGAPLVTTSPDTANNPDITTERLLELRRRGALERAATTPAERLDAQAFLQLEVVDRPDEHLVAPVAAVAGAGRASYRQAGPCGEVVPEDRDPQVLVEVPEPTAFSVRAGAAGEVGASLLDPDAGPSRFRTAPVAAGQEVWVQVTRPGRLVLAVPLGGTTTLCGLGPERPA